MNKYYNNNSQLLAFYQKTACRKKSSDSCQNFTIPVLAGMKSPLSPFASRLSCKIGHQNAKTIRFCQAATLLLHDKMYASDYVPFYQRIFKAMLWGYFPALTPINR